MKKRIVCLTLALMMSTMQVVSVSASREDELREEQAITSQQLDATYSRMDELANAKAQLESEISELDSSLVSVMVSIDTLKNDIDNKEVDIIKTKQDLAKAQKARDTQYENMKKRIQCLYEQGGDTAWFQMMLNSEDLSDLLTRAENTQQMYEQDRKNLDKYVNTIEEVKNLKAQYESDKAELEEMKSSYEEQSYVYCSVRSTRKNLHPQTMRTRSHMHSSRLQNMPTFLQNRQQRSRDWKLRELQQRKRQDARLKKKQQGRRLRQQLQKQLKKKQKLRKQTKKLQMM